MNSLSKQFAIRIGCMGYVQLGQHVFRIEVRIQYFNERLPPHMIIFISHVVTTDDYDVLFSASDDPRLLAQCQTLVSVAATSHKHIENLTNLLTKSHKKITREAAHVTEAAPAPPS
jgi:hypothetical protein